MDDGAEKWHYNGIRRRDGVVVPPIPDKKKGGRITAGTVPLYSPTPVLPAINTVSNQVSVPLTGSTAQIVTVSAQSDGIVSPSSPILKAQLSAPLRPSPPPPQPVVRGTQVRNCFFLDITLSLCTKSVIITQRFSD